MVWMTPMFPSVTSQQLATVNVKALGILSRPPTTLPANATQKLVDRPTISMESMVPAHPSNKTGFRPIRSENAPQNMPVRLSERAKAEMKMPAKKDALLSSPTLKSLTMTQAYGKLVKVSNLSVGLPRGKGIP